MKNNPANLKMEEVSGTDTLTADQTNQFGIDMKDIVSENLLNGVDILTAIDYYGITELLDMIGEDKIKSHLDSNE